jgi:glyoxylase-like metal-dependent hydrolase (beta-lactamase superfamily II)
MVERLIVGAMDTNCYIYSNGKKECVIIDPGADEERIISSVNMLKMVPVGIVLTHGHCDHTGAVGTLREHYRKEKIEVQVAIHAADRRFLGRTARKANLDALASLGVSETREFQDQFAGLPEPDLILAEGQKVLSSGLIVLETPGHTRGGICLYSEKDCLSPETPCSSWASALRLPGGSEKCCWIHPRQAAHPPRTRVFRAD